MSEEQKNIWIKEQRNQLSLVSPHIIPNNSNVGFFFKVNNLEIPEAIYKEEFDQIRQVYFSVIEKIKSHQS